MTSQRVSVFLLLPRAAVVARGEEERSPLKLAPVWDGGGASDLELLMEGILTQRALLWSVALLRLVLWRNPATVCSTSEAQGRAPAAGVPPAAGYSY